MRSNRLRVVACVFLSALACAPSSAQQPDVERLAEPITVVPASSVGEPQQQFDAIVGEIRGGSELTLQAPVLARGDASGRLIRIAADQLVDAVAIPTERVQQLSSEIVRRITAERSGSASALDTLRQELGESGRSAIRMHQWMATTENMIAVDPRPGDLRVNETFAVAIERARLNGFRVDVAQMQLLPDPGRLESLIAHRPALAPVARRYRDTIGAFADFLRAPSPESRARAVTASRMTFEAFVEAWPSLREDWASRRVAVRALDGLALQSELKATYGIRSNFLPESYQAIFLQSARTVSLHDGQGHPICSGLALSAEWVMTAGHCFRGSSWQTMTVGFSLSGNGPTTSVPIYGIWPDPPPGSRSGDNIDYAFVRVQPSPALASEFSELEQRIRAAGARLPLCLRRRPGQYEEPIVVIAQLGVARRVYDHAYIWYPYELYEPDYRRVSAMTGIRLHRFAEAVWPDSRAQQEEFLTENLRNLELAYSSYIGSDSDRRRAYRWVPDAGSLPPDPALRRPMFGFDTDTEHGNSGGAVFSRNDACVIGVFSGGRPDGVLIDESTWKEHEFATPISALLADVRQRTLPTEETGGNTPAQLAELVQLLNGLDE